MQHFVRKQRLSQRDLIFTRTGAARHGDYNCIQNIHSLPLDACAELTRRGLKLDGAREENVILQMYVFVKIRFKLLQFPIQRLET